MCKSPRLRVHRLIRIHRHRAGARPGTRPVQPINVEPGLGVAVKVTAVAVAKAAAHPAAGQLMPAGLLVIVPPPFPLSVVVSVNSVVLNFAMNASACPLHVPRSPQPVSNAPEVVGKFGAVPDVDSGVPSRRYSRSNPARLLRNRQNSRRGKLRTGRRYRWGSLGHKSIVVACIGKLNRI